MPSVPLYDSARVAPAGMPNVSNGGISPRALEQGVINGQNLERMGSAITTLGVQDMDAEAREQMLANQVRVDAALNDVRAAQQKLTYDPEQGYQAKTGAAAIQPNDKGEGLQDQYGQQLQNTITSASDGLANDAQRQVFARQAAQLATQFNGQIQGHVLQQYKQFGMETQQGTIDLATDTAKKNWNNPDIINEQVASIKAATWKAGQIAGHPANMVEAATQQATSKVHYGVVETALVNNNPAYAQRYIDKYKDDMTAGDLLKATGQITADMQGRVATGTAQNAMLHFATSFQPTDVDRMRQITYSSESSNNPNAVGPYVPGQGTAKGINQVMDATNRDPGFGVTPAKDDSVAERKRVGDEYLAAMVKKYAGDPAKAWAAYNAGPGRVDEAITRANAHPGGDWLTMLPAETQAYVSKNVTQLQSGGGAPALPSLQDVHNNIREQLGPSAQPKVLKAALDEGTRQYTDAMNDRKQQGENAVQQAQQYLIQNNGDFGSMPPAMKANLIAFAPDKYDNIQEFAGKVANPKTADNMAAYHEAINRPDMLAQMSDTDFSHFVMKNFKEETQKQIAKLRQETKTGKVGLGADDINQSAINTELDNRLTSIGMNKPKPSDGDEAKAQYATIQKFINDGIYTQQQQLGRKMTDKEITDYVDRQFLKSTELPGMIYGTNITPTLKMKVGDIPSNQLTLIKAALAKQGNTEPSNDQILRTYWKTRTNG